MHGQCCRGAAVDCIRFVVAVLDELYGMSPEPVPVLPPDTSWHNPRGAFEVARIVERRYPHDKVEGDVVEPGDVIVFKIAESPGHVAIVGPRPGTIWHSNPGVGVVEAGLGEVGTMLLHAWRLKGKDQWPAF